MCTAPSVVSDHSMGIITRQTTSMLHSRTAAPHLLAALWEPMSLGRPCDSAEAVCSFTKRGSAMDARLHTCRWRECGDQSSNASAAVQNHQDAATVPQQLIAAISLRSSVHVCRMATQKLLQRGVYALNRAMESTAESKSTPRSPLGK